MKVEWQERHSLQRELYEQVTEYVRTGYNKAIREKKPYVGFLMVLFQRLVSSSTAAIADALERRLQILTTQSDQLHTASISDLADQEMEESLEEALTVLSAGINEEKKQLELLLALARQAQFQFTDAKAEQPVMLHHIPDFVRRSSSKPAVVVIDGMSFVDWQIIREYLADTPWRVNVSSVFSFLPSVTSIARQSLFSGKVPVQNAKPFSLADEEKQWRQYWTENGLRDDEVYFGKTETPEIPDKVKAAGIVVNFIDDLMHRQLQGTQGMVVDINTWLKNGALHDEAVEVARYLTKTERLPVHWTLMLVRFSIFTDLCSVLGHLFELKDSVSAVQIKEEIYNKWGARTTLDASLSKNLKSLREIGALARGEKYTSYVKVTHTVSDPKVVALLFAAVMLATDQQYMTWESFIAHPAIFPFVISDVTQADMAAVPYLAMERMGEQVVFRIKETA